MHGGVSLHNRIAMHFCDKVSCNNINAITITCNNDIYNEMAVVHKMYTVVISQKLWVPLITGLNSPLDCGTGLFNWNVWTGM